MSETQRRIQAIRGLTGAFCLKVQNLELGVLCSQAIDQLAQLRRQPLAIGNEAEWAAAIIHTVDNPNQLNPNYDASRLVRIGLLTEFKIPPEIITRKSVHIRRWLLHGNPDMEAAGPQLNQDAEKLARKGAGSAPQPSPPPQAQEPKREVVTNPKRSSGEFLDKPRAAREELARLGEITRAKEKKLQILQLKDQDFMTPYVLLAKLSSEVGELKMADRYYERGYIRLNKRLTGADGQWPEIIDPQSADNVHITDFLLQRAAWLNKRGHRDLAISELRRLLQLCPGEGTSVKLLLALVLENISVEQLNKQYGGANAMPQWFNSVFEKYPEDFGSTRLPSSSAKSAPGG